MQDSTRQTLETGTDELIAEIDSQVAIVTLNRPQARNALSNDLSPALRRLIPRLANDDNVRSLLITGAGSAFCAGGDVKGMGSAKVDKTREAPRSREEVVEDLRVRQWTLTGALYHFPKPTLAAPPGPAAGSRCAVAIGQYGH